MRRLHRAEQILLVAAATDTARGGFDRQHFLGDVQAVDAAGELQPVQGLGCLREGAGRGPEHLAAPVRAALAGTLDLLDAAS